MKDAKGKNELDIATLIMFRCPHFQESGCKNCVFITMSNAGLKCKDKACSIRVPENGGGK